MMMMMMMVRSRGEKRGDEGGDAVDDGAKMTMMIGGRGEMVRQTGGKNRWRSLDHDCGGE